MLKSIINSVTKDSRASVIEYALVATFLTIAIVAVFARFGY